MIEYRESLSPREERATLVGVVVLVLVSASLFHPTLTAYVSLHQVQTATVAVDDVHLDDGAEALVVELTVENPTGQQVTVTGAQIFARVDGTLVNSVAGTQVGEAPIPARGTTTTGVRLPLVDDHTETVQRWADGDGQLALSGELRVRIRDRQEGIRLEWSE
jgi:LEA14-like dessication related protein